MSITKTRKSFDSETSAAIGDRIKKGRGDRTQEEFAALIGVSRSALTNYEAGRRLPNDLILKRISEVTGVIETEILFGKTEIPFHEYMANVADLAMRMAQERPGFIPRFMLSDDEYAVISLLRLLDDPDRFDLISRLVVMARAINDDERQRWNTPIEWGDGYIERLEGVIKSRKFEIGYDPDQSFWATFGEHLMARQRK